MSTLPIELFSEILKYLPIKPLSRFKSVSKFFNSLISSPNFIKSHLNQTLFTNSHRHLILSHSSLSLSPPFDDHTKPHLKFNEIQNPFKTHNPKIEFEDNPFGLIFSNGGVELLGSCNGVVCIGSSVNPNDVVLINPTSKAGFFKLPYSYIACPDDLLVFGFGYDSFSDDYKVVRLAQCCGCHDDGEVENEAKVYSFKSNSWKRVNDIEYYLLYKDSHGVLVNENLHYVVTKKEFDIRHKFMVRFELRNEKFVLMEKPEYEDELGNLTLFMSSLGGCLSLMVNYNDELGCADLWVMKEYGRKESWVRLFRLRKEETIRSFHQIKAIACSGDGRKVFLEQDNSKLRWLDLESKRAKTVKVRGVAEEYFDTGVYVESLVSVAVEKAVSRGGEMPRKVKKKSDVDNFLAVGFKLKL